jgi:hypothetical protein
MLIYNMYFNSFYDVVNKKIFLNSYNICLLIICNILNIQTLKYFIEILDRRTLDYNECKKILIRDL